ncbi:MAG TPA: hypothetical protein VN695_01850 [Streptosporangiaceae bacterium]|nr:hypothetical protein [Streptosporangiaceae bacterium]
MTSNATEGSGLVDLIAAELRILHKGRGIQAGDLDKRVGPHLRELASGDRFAGDRAGADKAALRQSLTIQLSGCAAQLPQDVRLAVTASLALSGKTKEMATLRVRLEWLSDQIDRNYRTAERRMDEAEMLLAEQVAQELLRRRGRTPTAPRGWYLAEIRTLLRLDTPTPESHEHRRIVSTSTDLHEIMAWADVPSNSNQRGTRLSGEVLYGGRLVRQEHPFGNRFQFVVQLPVPLQPGEEHEYGMITRVRAGEPMSSHYLVTPECQCDALKLRVRFHPDHPPRWVRRVVGETVRMYEDPRPTGDLLTPDDAGEVRVEFRDLAMYLGYGVQWEP